jgi:hypothetical protein
MNGGFEWDWIWIWNELEIEIGENQKQFNCIDKVWTNVLRRSNWEISIKLQHMVALAIPESSGRKIAGLNQKKCI